MLGPGATATWARCSTSASACIALALQPDARFPFKPEDELTKPEEKSPEAAAKAAVKSPGADEADGAKSAAVAAATAAAAPASRPREAEAADAPGIVYAGLRERLYEVPVAPGNYRALAVDDKRLYLLEAGDDGAKGTLKTLAIARSARSRKPLPPTCANSACPTTASTSSTAPSPRARRATC
jgi:hypothetical protein